MMSAQFDDRVRVVVHADAPCPWQTKCWEVTGALKEGNAGEAKIGVAKKVPCNDSCLLDFVQKCVDKYESDHYLLVLWGHGEGIDWKEKVLAGRAPSQAIEGAGKRFAPGSQGAIEVGELGKALAELRLERVKKENVVVGFDACLMGMVEIYDEIQPYVGWGVAANDEIPVTGWPYMEILQLLGKVPEIEPKDLAKNIVDICAKWYSVNSPNTKVSFAACNLSKSWALLEATASLTSQLTASLTSEQTTRLTSELETRLTGELKTSTKETPVRDAVRAARDFAEDLQEIAYVDLYAFCSELKRQTERTESKVELKQLGPAASSVLKKLDDFVIEHNFSDDYPFRFVEDARAVSICFPESDALVGSIPGILINWGSYKELTFSQTTHWHDFLAEFWGRQPDRVDSPSANNALGVAAGRS